MFPYASTKVKTVNSWKHQIEQEQSWRLALTFGYDIRRCPKPSGGESCLLQMKANQASDILIILHQYDRGRKVRAIKH